MLYRYKNPFNPTAVREGDSRILTTKYDINVTNFDKWVEK